MCPPEALRQLLLRARAAGGGARQADQEGSLAARFFPFVAAMFRKGPSAADPSTSSRRAEQTPSRGAFPEEQFLLVCRELAKSSEGAEASWQLLARTRGFSIYRLRDEKSGLYEYKVYGTLDDCPPELCADVYMDLNYRVTWDQFLKELSEKTHDGRTAIYWEVKFPFPLANRDYVFIHERRDLAVDGQKIYVILAKSVNCPKFPEKPGIVRVKNYRQSVAFQSDGKKGSKVFMSYFDDPGGKLPSWIVNWATKAVIYRGITGVPFFLQTGVPNFLKDMQKACHTYHKR